MLDNEKLLFDELYEKTKDCGRVQFVELLMTKERENKELKLQLKGTTHCFDEEEHEKLKKQLENKNKQIEYLHRSIERKEDTIIDLQNETIPYTNEYVCKLETQQKEFINYLEDEIKNIQIKWGNKLTEKGYIDIAMTVRAYQIILKKYKEIIGDDKQWEQTTMQ